MLKINNEDDSGSDEMEMDRSFITGLDPRVGYGLVEEESEVDSEDDKEQPEHDEEEEEDEEEENDDNPDFKAEVKEVVLEQKKKKSIKTWTNLNVCRPLQRAIDAAGFFSPTEVQCQAIEPIVKGYDVCIRSVTGSGKTAAFLVPILHNIIMEPRDVESTLSNSIRVLIVEPTRELAWQCANMCQQLAVYSTVKSAVVTGGVGQADVLRTLQEHPQVVICTPGRMIDLILNSGISIGEVEVFVLDEADKLVMGFESELQELFKHLPKTRQTIQLSATMTRKVDALAQHALYQPINIDIGPMALSSTLQQEFIRVPSGETPNKPAYLLVLLQTLYKSGVLVFTRNKVDVHRLFTLVSVYGLKCVELQGNMSQDDRLISLQKFREKKADVLICSDLASRGLDLQGVKHVINYDMPPTIKTYIHRVGRAARMGARGTAISLCCDDNNDDVALLRNVLKLDRLNNSSLLQQELQEGKIKHHQQVSNVKKRTLDSELVEASVKQVTALIPKLHRVLSEEKVKQETEKAEREAQRVEQRILHGDELTKPKKQWHESKQDQQLGQVRARLRERTEQLDESKQDASYALTSHPRKQGELTELFQNNATLDEREKRKRNPLDDMDDAPDKKKQKTSFGSKKQAKLEEKADRRDRRESSWKAKPFEKESKMEKKMKKRKLRVKKKQERMSKGITTKRIKTQSGTKTVKRKEEPSGKKLKAMKRAESKSARFKSKSRYKRR